MKKGISPLIGGVLLVAFTLAVGAIAAQFLTGQATEQTTRASETGEQTLTCGSTSAKILPSTVNYDATNDLLLFTVQNTGAEDVHFPQISLLDSNGIATTSTPADNSGNEINSTSPLTSGGLVTINVTSVATQPEKVILSTNCPGKTTAVENSTDTDDEWKLVFD